MHQAKCRAMSRRLTIAATLLLLLAFPAGALAAKSPPAQSPSAKGQEAEKGAPGATVKIRVGHIHGGKARILSTVPVTGSLSPFVAGQKVEVTFFLNGRELISRKLKVSKGSGNSGSFHTKIRIEEDGKYAVSARHEATAA